MKQHSRGASEQNCDKGMNDKDRRPPLLKLKCKVSVDDDINQLFEEISIRTSRKGMDSLDQSGASPLRKNALKKPIAGGTPRSSGFGSTEPVTLKQALRELCISKASEMAASKRLSKSRDSGVSDSGRMQTTNDAVSVRAGHPSPSVGSKKARTLEISLVPAESKSNVFEKMPQSFRMSELLDQSSNSSQFSVRKPQDKAGTSWMKNEFGIPSREVTSQTCKPELGSKIKQIRKPFVSSSQMSAPEGGRHDEIEISSMPKEGILNSFETVVHHAQASKLRPSNQYGQSSRFGVAMKQDGSGPSALLYDVSSATKEVGSNHDTLSAVERVWSDRHPFSSPQFSLATKQDASRAAMVQSKNVSALTGSGVQTIKMVLAEGEEHNSRPHYGGDISRRGVNESTKMPNKASKQKLGQERSLQSTANKSRIGHKVTKTSVCPVKPVTRNRIVIKKKVKLHSTSKSVASKDDNINNNVVPPSPVCQRCHCALSNVNNESSWDSNVSSLSGPNTKVKSTGFIPGLNKTDFPSNDYNPVTKAKDFKSNKKGVFSQSSGSLGEYCSTSTSISEDSNASISTCGNKPHMSKDVRWAAIQNIQMQHGILDLGHFNLLKKLGCGDIGTVYLARLVGTNCLFAIKVMDNEFLVRRKKMLRVQTEREILRMLDHPFLPTLYAQFISDNLTCLVMEYCPGGDLHVLRQKQPTKCFSEPAARFYVAEVLLALEYLHMLGIVYRDLKPENILVREDGHIMLSDFDLSLRCDVNPTLMNCSSSDMDPARMSGPCASSSCIAPLCVDRSCQVSCFSPRLLPGTPKTRKLRADIARKVRSWPQLVAEPTDARSNSFVGTHEYLAPEIISGEGHGAAVDWWTYGIFLYELLYGKTPFKGYGHDDTLANVVLQSLKFPEAPFVSLQARDLIRGLLAKDPQRRLGSVKGAAEIKQHPFFAGLNWALIRCAIPPEVPEFYDYGSSYMVTHEKSNKLLECNATGEHLEFELF